MMSAMIRKVALERIGGASVFTALAEPEQPTQKLIIMAHGFRGSSIGPARTFVDFERRLVGDGFSCLRFDQPGSGNSDGDFFGSSFNRWVDTIAHFASRYLEAGYRVGLLGQSMGATATVIAASRSQLRLRVPCILLWVPDPKSTVEDFDESSGEEGGQRYPTRFWTEARDADFFGCLSSYPGAVHLVYGEDDEYVSPELRQQVIAAVQGRGHPTLVLSGQGHSSWAYQSAQQVFAEQRRFLSTYFTT